LSCSLPEPSGSLVIRRPIAGTGAGPSAHEAPREQYPDIHLSHVAQFVWFGFLGKLKVAVVEVAGPRLRGHARHLLRHRAAAAPPANPGAASEQPHRRRLPARRPGQGGRDRRDPPVRSQPEVHAIRRGFRAHAEHILDFLGHEVSRGRVPLGDGLRDALDPRQRWAAKALTPAVSPRPQEAHPPPLESANQHGEVFRIGVWTGASTAPELDGALAKVGGIEPVLFALSSPIWLDSEEYTVSPRRS
jgi:hypothetical protein